MQLIDAEVHLGTGVFITSKGTKSIDCNIDTFGRQIKRLNLRHAIGIPAPTYSLRRQDGGSEVSCLWEKKGHHISYKKIITENKKTRVVWNPRSPYLEMNRHTLSKIRDKNAELHKNFFYFAPILHPLLDRMSDLEELLNDDLTVAIKIHGISTHCGPSNVPDWAVKLSHNYDIPIFVHTDAPLHNPITRFEREIAEVREMNKASRWARWAEKSNVRIYLAHGAMLENRAIRLVNRSSNMIVGLGPDSVLSRDQSRTGGGHGKETYLSRLFREIDHRKIVFSSDFPFNTKRYGATGALEWGGKARVISSALSEGLNRNEIEGILSLNAARFFGM